MGESMIAKLVLIVVVLVAIWAFRTWLDPSKRVGRRRSADLLTRIANAEDGDIVAIHGYVRREQAMLHSPLTSRPCVAYSVFVETGGKPLVEESRMVDFCVEDATGTALVRSEGALAELVDPQTGSVGDSFAELESLLERHGGGETMMNRTMRYREATVQLDQPILVTGRVHWESIDRAPGRRLVFESTPEATLRITNDLSPLDGG